MKLDLKLIGENILIARVVRNYSQDGLANKLGKSQNWLQKAEKGEVDLSINIIENIAQELNIPSSQLLYSQAGQIFNNCTIGNNAQSFNQCIFNSEELMEKLTKALFSLEKKL